MTALMEKPALLGSCAVQYRVTGSGDPLVLFHPSSGVRATHAVQAFAKRFTVFQPTFPGFDGTALPEEAPGVVPLARLMAEFIKTVVGQPATVAGHSFGGWVAAWLAILEPGLVNTLILQCPLGFGPLTTHPPGATAADVLARTYAHPERRVAETRTDDQVAKNRALASRYGHGLTEDSALMAHIPSLRIPTLVVYGRSDGIVQRLGLEKLVQAAPGAKLEIVDDAAHHVESDQPQRYVDLVAEFVTSVSKGASA